MYRKVYSNVLFSEIKTLSFMFCLVINSRLLGQFLENKKCYSAELFHQRF